MNQEYLGEIVRQRLSAGEETDAVLTFLRHQGVSKGQSILALAAARQIDLVDAERIVVQSTAWNDREESDRALSAEVWRILQEGGNVRPDGAIDVTDWLKQNDG